MSRDAVQGEFIIQPATAQHAAGIQSLVRSSGINPTGLAWQRFLVALDAAGALIGCVQVKPHGDGSRELASLAVVPQWQSHGVARALVEAILAQNSGTLYLMCQARLGVFYEKFGFSRIPVDEMSTYFRRVSKLAGVVLAVRKADEQLLVMRRAGA
ncbi:MAG TPA: GNAT family N-acetyltransferase [Anaerolineales bacterium]|nr:GNAT family N-acetyltransferase [Anaerolineales bacterium]HRQ91965.1 GNAT family N-acetyltransferase [Anaerolineales bacterium]